MLGKKNRIFICPILPSEKIAEYGGSIAANNFCYNLISGDGFNHVFSYIPLGCRTPQSIIYKDNRIETSYSHKIRNNCLLSKFCFIYECYISFSKIHSNSCVWFYNLPYTIIPLFLMLRLLKPSVQCNLIMLDFTPGRKGIKRISDTIELLCINHMHGMIKLADSPLFKVKNSVCLPGVVPSDGVEYPKVENVTKDFLISGALGDNISMLSMLLDAFSQMPELTLHITGKAPDEEKVERYASQYKNIIYYGMVEYDEYLRILHNTPFLLSTRNPHYPENQCNFPSKVIEALLHNRIVISTIYYPQFDGIKYFNVTSDIVGFKDDIQRISSLEASELMLYANHSYEVKARFNVTVWNECMAKIENNHD